MIRIVLDTNIVVSALLSSAGFEDRVVKLALRGHVQLYVSLPIITEYYRVLSSPKFGFSKSEVRRILTRIHNCGHTVRPMRTLTKCQHEEDNRFLECAEVGGADFLVTGNARHFPKDYKTTKIVNARQLLELLTLGRNLDL